MLKLVICKLVFFVSFGVFVCGFDVINLGCIVGWIW